MKKEEDNEINSQNKNSDYDVIGMKEFNAKNVAANNGGSGTGTANTTQSNYFKTYVS